MRLRIATLGGACALAAVASVSTARAEDAPRQTACTKLDFCYCVKPELLPAIADNVAKVRKIIADRKAEGKEIGYLSIPLSPAGGGSFAINSAAAGNIAESITTRFGKSSVWILNPAALGGDHMTGANGADYMYMWTEILEGATGHGEDFDFLYFVGQTDFAGYFLASHEDKQGQAQPTKDRPKQVKDEPRVPDNYLGWLDAAFDERLASLPAFKTEVEQGQVTRAGFRNYYGLRASVAFSYGSHDEWNIARMLNERRRGADNFGIANQLAIFFDGQAVNPGDFDAATTPGDAGRCVK
jgi:hypothetical protein